MLALLPLVPARAAGASVPAAELPPIEVDQDELQPAYRLEYGHRATGPHGDYLGLMATRNIFALLYEHEKISPTGAGAYSMDRVGFMIGGPSRPSGEDDGQLYIGLGETRVRGAQQAGVVSLLVHVTMDYEKDDLGVGIPEIKLAIPLNGGSNARETDGEFGWYYRWKHGTLRFGYRVFSVNATGRADGWYTGLGLVY